MTAKRDTLVLQRPHVVHFAHQRDGQSKAVNGSRDQSVERWRSRQRV